MHTPDSMVVWIRRSKQLCSRENPQKWSLPRLQVLKLDGCPMMTDVDLYHTVAALSELRRLSVEGDPAWIHPMGHPEQVSLRICVIAGVSIPYCSSLGERAAIGLASRWSVTAAM